MGQLVVVTRILGLLVMTKSQVEAVYGVIMGPHDPWSWVRFTCGPCLRARVPPFIDLSKESCPHLVGLLGRSRAGRNRLAQVVIVPCHWVDPSEDAHAIGPAWQLLDTATRPPHSGVRSRHANALARVHATNHATPALRDRCWGEPEREPAGKSWCAIRDSNPEPAD